MNIFEDLFLKKVNGVTDTEEFMTIGWGDMDESEFFNVITQRTKGNLKQYFLFDFLKIWQRRLKENPDG